MSTHTPRFSNGFERLYCDKTVFESFSKFHPISFAGVLPFQSQDTVVDDERLIEAETAHLAGINDDTRRGVIEAYRQCGLLEEAEAAGLSSVSDFFAADFFELMGEIYANAGMFICALRWHRELIVELETQGTPAVADRESVYASAGYCLYSLGCFAEAVAWSKSCIGPRPIADVVCRALINHEAREESGAILSVERAGPRARYTVSAFDPAKAGQTTSRLKTAMQAVAPFQEIQIDWVGLDAPAPEIQPGGYPFKAEYDGSNLIRHKMNLIFATCAQADALVEQGQPGEAKRLLSEAFLLEPEAAIVLERLRALE